MKNIVYKLDRHRAKINGSRTRVVFMLPLLGCKHRWTVSDKLATVDYMPTLATVDQLLQRDRAMLVNSCSFTKYGRLNSKSDLQGHWQWCHIRFLVNVTWQLCLYLAPLTRYDHLFPKIYKRSRKRDPKRIPLGGNISRVHYSTPMYQSSHET